MSVVRRKAKKVWRREVGLRGFCARDFRHGVRCWPFLSSYYKCCVWKGGWLVSC